VHLFPEVIGAVVLVGCFAGLASPSPSSTAHLVFTCVGAAVLVALIIGSIKPYPWYKLNAQMFSLDEHYSGGGSSAPIV